MKCKWLTKMLIGLFFSLALMVAFQPYAHADIIFKADEEWWVAEYVLVDGETIHLVADHDVGGHTRYICYEVTRENELAECTYGCNDTPAQYSNGVAYAMGTPSGRTYGVSYDGHIFRWTPGEKEAWTYLSSNEQIREIYDSTIEENLPSVRYVASDQAIYECSRDGSRTWHFARYDVQTGERREIYTSQEGLPPYMATLPEDALVLAWPGEPLLRVNPDGTTEKYPKPMIDLDYEGITYAPGRGFLILTSKGIYQMDDKGKTTFLNYAPPHKSFFNQEIKLVYLPQRDELAFVGASLEDSFLYTVSLQLQEINELKLGGFPAEFLFPEDYKFAFESKHENIRVQAAAEYVTTSFDNVAKRMTVQDPNCDLFLLRTDDGGLASMLRKGYFVPLDDVPELAQFAETLYPAWKGEITAPNGALAAMPVWVGGNTATAYNREVWEREELGTLPTTYAELLDCIQRWSDEGILGQMRLFDDKNSMQVITNLLLRASVAHDDSQGQTPVFTNDTLLALLKRLDEMRPIFAANDQQQVYQNTLMRTMCSAGPESVDMAPETLLYLGFEDAEDVQISRTLYAYIINPYSKHQEEAKAYLTTITQKMEKETRFSLQDTGEEGVISKWYLKSHTFAASEYNAMLESYDTRLAEGWPKESLDARLEEYEQWLAELENERYSITPEAAEAYRRTMRQGAVNRESGMALIYENASSTISAFIDGKISPEEMCRKLDEVVRMWVMENE